MALKSWAEASASPAYQNADENKKAQMRQQFTQAGGVIPEEAPAQAPQEDQGLLHDAAAGVGHFVQGTAAGVGRQVARGIGGLVEAGEHMVGSNSVYGKRIQQRADEVYQRHMQEAGNGTAAQLGSQWGTTAANIGAYIAAPEVMIPMQATLAGGEAYANQADDKKSVLGATGVGLANLYAGKILPKGGGEAAEGILNKALNVARTVKSGVVAGAKGGAAVGASEAASENPDASLGDIVTGAVEGGLKGGAFGGTLAAGHVALGNVANKIAPRLSEQGITPSPEANVNNARQMDAIAGSEFLANRGIPLTDARLHGNEDAQAAFGKSQTEVDKSRSVGREARLNTRLPFGSEVPAGSKNATKEVWERQGKQLVQDMDTSLTSISDSVRDMKNEASDFLASSATTNNPRMAAASREELAGLNKFEKDFTAYKTSMSKAGQEGNRQEQIEEFANRAQESFESLHPDTQAKIRQDYIPVEGLGEGLDFAAHAKVYGNGLRQLTEMHPQFRSSTTNATKATDVELNVTSPIKSAKSIIDMARSGSARKNFQEEQARALEETRQLAAGMRRAQETVASNRPTPENPPQEVQDDLGLQMSEAEPAATAQEAAVSEAPKPQPDQGVVHGGETPAQRYRRMKAEADELQRQAQTQTEAPPEAPRPSPDQVMTQNPTRPQTPPEAVTEPVETPAPQEPIPVDTTFNQEQARTAFKRSMGREPTPEEVAEAEAAQRAALTEQLQQRMGNVREFARSVARPEAPAAEPVPEAQPAPEPVVEPAPKPAPDQVVTKTPPKPKKQQEEEKVETAAEAPKEAPEKTKPSPDQVVTKTPKQAEKAPEKAPEPTPKAEPDIKEASWRSGHERRTMERTLKATKDMFTTDKVKGKITLENMENKHFLQQMRREDAAENIGAIRHAVEQANKHRAAREEVQHELNVNELDRWGREHKIPSEFITNAIKEMGLEKAKILGVNDIKRRATKAYIRETTPVTPEEAKAAEAPKATFKEQDKDFDDLINGPEGNKRDIPDSVKAEMYKTLKADARYKTSQIDGRALSDSEMRDIRVKLYNTESRELTRLGKEAAAGEAKTRAEAEAKAVEKQKAKDEAAAKHAENVQAGVERRAALKKVGTQITDIDNEIRKSLKGVPDDVADQWRTAYMDRHFLKADTPLSDLQYRKAMGKAGEEADKFKAKHEKGLSSIQKEREIRGGESTEGLDMAEKAQKAAEERIEKSGTTSDEEMVGAVSQEVIDQAISAFNKSGAHDVNSVKAVEDAVKVLSKIYGRDVVESQPMFNFAKLVSKSAEMRRKYPDNPETWLSKNDFRMLQARQDAAAGNTLKSLAAENILGKGYSRIVDNILTEEEIAARRARLDSGEKLKSMDLTTSKGREAALSAATQKKAEQTVKVKPAKKSAKPERTEAEIAYRNQAAKVKRMQTRLNNDENWIHDDERGTKWKGYQSAMKSELAKLNKMPKK